jgi:hypothetical protein
VGVELADRAGRDYDPNTGRFMQEDPIWLNAGDHNVYRYVGNNPLKYTDPAARRPSASPATTRIYGPPTTTRRCWQRAKVPRQLASLSPRSPPTPTCTWFRWPPAATGRPGFLKPGDRLRSLERGTLTVTANELPTNLIQPPPASTLSQWPTATPTPSAN